MNSRYQERLIIIDECIEGKYRDIIRNDGWLHYDINRMNPGISDEDVLEIAEKYNGIIFTHDKDFIDYDNAYVWKGRNYKGFKKKYKEIIKMLC